MIRCQKPDPLLEFFLLYSFQKPSYKSSPCIGNHTKFTLDLVVYFLMLYLAYVSSLYNNNNQEEDLLILNYPSNNLWIPY